jgi:hypothetical protein
LITSSLFLYSRLCLLFQRLIIWAIMGRHKHGKGQRKGPARNNVNKQEGNAISKKKPEGTGMAAAAALKAGLGSGLGSFLSESAMELQSEFGVRVKHQQAKTSSKANDACLMEEERIPATSGLQQTGHIGSTPGKVAQQQQHASVMDVLSLLSSSFHVSTATARQPMKDASGTQQQQGAAKQPLHPLHEQTPSLLPSAGNQQEQQ